MDKKSLESGSIMSLFEKLPSTPPDAAFSLLEAFKTDPHPSKVDLTPGFYRDENAKPWILPAVSKVQTH